MYRIEAAESVPGHGNVQYPFDDMATNTRFFARGKTTQQVRSAIYKWQQRTGGKAVKTKFRTRKDADGVWVYRTN